MYVKRQSTQLGSGKFRHIAEQLLEVLFPLLVVHDHRPIDPIGHLVSRPWIHNDRTVQGMRRARELG
jgi:hypothetical protein